MRLRHGRLLAGLCLGATFPLLWFAAWQGSRGNDLDTYESQFLELRQRLLYAEKENKRRSHELSSALDEIRRIVATRANLTTNLTDDMKLKIANLPRKLPMHLTNMHYYLPHLREYEDGIFPDVIFGQQRTGVSLVMGIPTVKREKKNYLISTLHSLLHGLSEEQEKDCVIIIFVAELEDDIIAKPDYIASIKSFAAQQSQDWMVLEFSQLGFIGKLFKSEDLPLIVEFFLMFYKDKPVDWLIDHLLWVKVCNPEKDAAHCEQEKSKFRIRAKPSLFQHMGIHSSLAGKIQNLKDKDFGKNVLHKAHKNPPAEVDTSLRIYQQYTLEKIYKGEDCFWASAPVAGDYIRFTFLNPLKVEKYFFRSGNMEHPGDKLFNTTVEVLPADEMQKKELVDAGNKFNYPATKDGYLKIGAFENGIAEGSINQSIGRIKAIRLSISSDSPVWAILSEVLIKTSEN
ncbi:alpha-1,3-mannosyl-glycoprotein 4-beta-N-acetylglucosaminyltransferase-like protein MGAT4D isoform X2 [Manacus candei]|uniref:alpha-1,3-mannosyl-glycoprotein 4-beta-N-acetylglucosaminyltransferase-like protein MGAT4D isoform X2 n=1 Tax=Manacus candei TaxID=415023 RepID=UPI002226FB3C|nr:alpha-1,3-mannosyl-glycoprotein 4-beta-N-acetylglucosaminyltransferase-like protein MGAT4D isoform X2 [Manacus candei]